MEPLRATAHEATDKAAGLLRLAALGLRTPPTWVRAETSTGTTVDRLLSTGPVLLRPSVSHESHPERLSGLLPSIVVRAISELGPAIEAIRAAARMFGAESGLEVLVQPYIEPQLGGVMHIFPSHRNAFVAVRAGHPAALMAGEEMPLLEFWINLRQPVGQAPGYVVAQGMTELFEKLPSTLLVELLRCLELVAIDATDAVEVEWLHQPPTWFVQMQSLVVTSSPSGWFIEED